MTLVTLAPSNLTMAYGRLAYYGASADNHVMEK